MVQPVHTARNGRCPASRECRSLAPPTQNLCGGWETNDNLKRKKERTKETRALQPRPSSRLYLPGPLSASEKNLGPRLLFPPLTPPKHLTVWLPSQVGSPQSLNPVPGS